MAYKALCRAICITDRGSGMQSVPVLLNCVVEMSVVSVLKVVITVAVQFSKNC